MSTFAKRLQYLAELKNFDQAELSRALNKDRSTVNRWWNGEITPGIKNARAISDYFECDLTWLKSGIGEPYPQPGLTTGEPKNEYEPEAKRSSGAAIIGKLDTIIKFLSDTYGDLPSKLDDCIMDMKRDLRKNPDFRQWEHIQEAELIRRRKKQGGESSETLLRGNLTGNNG